MTSTNNNQNTFSIRSSLDKEKLNGTNFLTWSRNLRLVLKQERKEYILSDPLPEQPPANAVRAVQNAWEKHSTDETDVYCLMVATMTPELQMQFESVLSPIEMMASLKQMFQEQARTERFQTVKNLLDCKMSPNAAVSPHVLKMMGYLDHLQKLDCPINQELACDIALQSLPACYDQFILNFNMHGLTKTLPELHGMLKTAEPSLKKAYAKDPNVLMVQKGKGFKKSPAKAKGKGKAVQVSDKDTAKPKPKSKAGPTDICRFCKEPGHWRRDCKKFLEGLKNLKRTKRFYGIVV